MTREESLNKCIQQIELAIDKLLEEVGDEKVNFVGSLIVFDDKDIVIDNSTWWSMGDSYSCEINAECLLKDIQREREEDKIFDISLN
jgi:hypothetical protein